MKEYGGSMNEETEKKKKQDNQRVIVMKNNQNLLNMKVKRIRRDVKDDICDEKEKSGY